MGLVAATTDPQTAARGPLSFADAVGALRALTADELEAVNAEILGRMQSAVDMIPDVAGHLMSAGGKRVRPMLTIAAAKAFGYDGEDHIRLAAAVELIHGATLLHDDVVDASILRRGSETANTIWGNKESVLVGDFIFSRAFELMVAARDLRVLQVLSRASSVIAEGEVLQLSTQKNLATTYEMYIAVVDAKTAALFAAASQSGALIAGCGENDEAAMRGYGRNLGVAYQLIDDALDYSGKEQSLGKSVGDDFREGKMTLPVVYAVARSQANEMTFWRRVITNGDQRDGDFEHACELMTRYDAVEDTVLCAHRFANEALEHLSRAPGGVYVDALAALVESSIARIS